MDALSSVVAAVKGKRTLAVSSSDVEDVVAFEPDTYDRQSIIRAFFTPIGNATSEPYSSELYAVNPLPQASQLSQKKESDWQILLSVDGFHLKLWDSAALPSFAATLKQRFSLDASLIVFYVRVCLNKSERCRRDGHMLAPPLSAFVCENRLATFTNRVTRQTLQATLCESSSFPAGGRKTGFLAFSL